MLNKLAKDIYEENKKRGWWSDPKTGKPIKRNVGELLCLVHSEVTEAMEGYRKQLKDDKLPHRDMFEVELADVLIRVFDIAGAFKMDIEGAVNEKLEYNRKREDHKVSERLKKGGKKF